MNPNFFPPNPYRNSFVPDGGPARSPLAGGGQNNFYRSPNTSPHYRAYGPPRYPNSGSGYYARNPPPWTPGPSSSPGFGTSPSGGLNFFPVNAAGSPRYHSPIEGAFEKSNSSTPYRTQSGNNCDRGVFRHIRGSGGARFSGGGRQSWSGSPSSFPGNSTAGVKRLNSASNRVSYFLIFHSKYVWLTTR